MSSCTSSHTWCYATVCHLALPHIYDATLLHVVLHFLTYMMSDDVKAMVNQWVFRQSLGPITLIAFLEELKQLLKQWGKKAMKCCFAVVWNNAKWGTSKNIEFFAENPLSCHGRLSSVYLVWGLKQPVAFWCPLDLVLLQSPSYSKFHPWHDVLPWSSLLLRLWHESCPQNAPPGQNLALPM